MIQNQILTALSLLIVAINLVNTQLASDLDLLPHNQPSLSKQQPSLTRARRMYALCPPEFTKIGNDCYFLSKRKESWLDAHFECKDRNSKLAEPLKFADRRLRKYLKNKDQLVDEKWIGGMYNWQQEKWQWGYNGGDMKYQSFMGGDQESDLRYHCTSMDPKIDYMWSAKLCTERHYFICQHRMSYVNEKNRQRVYNKWNETYPNQLANEVEVYVSTNGNGNRSLYRNVPKRNRPSPNKAIQLNNQIPKAETPENAPDYLPYSVYSNLEQFQQKAQEDVIHPLQSPHATNVQLPSAKPKKRHSKVVLTGEVDLGTNKLRRNREKKLKKKPVVAEIPSNDVLETVTNPGRHHHHLEQPNEISEDEVTTRKRLPELVFETSEEPLVERTTSQPVVQKTTVSRESSKKLEDKALRRERLRAKLAALTPEERHAFILMKQQRAEAKKKGLNINN